MSDPAISATLITLSPSISLSLSLSASLPVSFSWVHVSCAHAAPCGNWTFYASPFMMLPQRTLPNIKGQQQHYRISGLSHSHIIWKIKFNILRFVCAVLYCSVLLCFVVCLLGIFGAHTKQGSVSQKKIKYKKLCERRAAKVPKTEVQTHTSTHTYTRTHSKTTKNYNNNNKNRTEYKQKAAFYEWRAPETTASDRQR